MRLSVPVPVILLLAASMPAFAVPIGSSKTVSQTHPQLEQRSPLLFGFIAKELFRGAEAIYDYEQSRKGRHRRDFIEPRDERAQLLQLRSESSAVNRSPSIRARGDQNSGNNLHVSGLSPRVDTHELEASFARFGRVKQASVMRDPHTHDSRGFGFVIMETGEEADAAIAALNGAELMGNIMKVDKARPGSAGTPSPGRYSGPPTRN